ncbi:MAG: ATP-binding protein [Pirellulaceae bacterium]|nr:ATP-binding protein [Pirellulaceae bacterium]
MSADFYTGSIVPPEDLWFRDEFIAELWAKLEKEHVLLTAPRRTGKTSVMNHMRERPQDNRLVVFQNVQDLKHPADLFQTIIENFHEQHQHFLRDLAGKGWGLLKGLIGSAVEKVEDVEFGGVKIKLRENDPDWKANWKAHAEELLSRIRQSKKQVLIIVDELPDMLLNMKLENAKEAREFMAWFRKQRETPPPSRDNIRWLVGGSINLTSTLDDLGGIDLINNLSTEQLPILTPDQVCEFVTKMLGQRDILFEAGVPSRVEQHLGRPIPLFLQMATQELARCWKRQPRMLTCNDVEDVFRNLITGSGAKDKLQHYYSRIQKYYPEPRAALAYKLLSMLSKSKSSGLTRNALKTAFEKEIGIQMPPAQRDLLFNKILCDLMNDFYIGEIKKDRFDFESGIMKAWWMKYYA